MMENLSIYKDSLSVYYLGSVFITILSVSLAWWYSKYSANKVNLLKDASVKRTLDLHEEETFEEFEKENGEDKDSEVNILSTMKIGRQAMLVEKIAASLSEEQLRKEKEAEKEQLEKIFQLLQEQEDKFQVSSLQELENQLRLYRK